MVRTVCLCDRSQRQTALAQLEDRLALSIACGQRSTDVARRVPGGIVFRHEVIPLRKRAAPRLPARHRSWLRSLAFRLIGVYCRRRTNNHGLLIRMQMPAKNSRTIIFSVAGFVLRDELFCQQRRKQHAKGALSCAIPVL